MIKTVSVYIATTVCQYLKTQLERIKKSLQKTFKEFGLEIVAESNLRIVNYLDVTLKLNEGSFRPCDKPDIIQYINKESNHPPHPPKESKHLLAYIEKRLSNNSSDKKTFQESPIYYQDTLNKAGYIDKVVYHTPQAQVTRKTKTKITNGTLYDLTYHIVKVPQIVQSFLHLNIHFPKNHTFNKIYNKNNVNVNCSCMQKIKAIINNHNMSILHQNKEIKDECNCRNKYCPLGGKCLSPNTVY